MDRIKIFLDYDFKNWNEYIAAERGSLYHANAIKQEEKQYIIAKLKGKYKYDGEYPVTLILKPHFKAKRRDLDNFRMKGLIDGLVASGVIKNDNLTCISKIMLEAVFDDKVGVDVEILPSKE